MNRPALLEEKILDMLKELCPGRISISLNHAAKLMGKDRRTLDKDPRFPRKQVAGQEIVSLPALAEWMAKHDAIIKR